MACCRESCGPTQNKSKGGGDEGSGVMTEDRRELGRRGDGDMASMLRRELGRLRWSHAANSLSIGGGALDEMDEPRSLRCLSMGA